MNLAGQRIEKANGGYLGYCDPIFELTEQTHYDDRRAWNSALDDGMFFLYDATSKMWIEARGELAK